MWKRIVSRDDSSAYKPHLTVVWHDLDGGRRGEESYYTRVPFDLGGGWRLAVGVHNGELTLDRGLFEIPSYGPPQSMSLSYSSLNAESAYLGTGWSSNLTQHLSFDGNDVYWHRADNGLVPFLWGGTSWTPTAGHFETLSLAGGEYAVTLKDQTKFVFEGTGLGRLKRILNRFGKALTLVWNSNSATATDASGRVTNMVISGALITSVTDSAGRTWQLGYTAGQLTTVTDPAGNATALVYTGGLLTGVNRSRFAGGHFWLAIDWTIAYTAGKVTSVTDPSHPTSPVPSTFAYNGTATTVSLLKTYSPIERNTWTYNLDAFGRVSSSIDPQGFTTAYVYDANSNLTQLTLPISKAPDPVTNQLISYTYDARGNVLSQTTALTATSNVLTAMSYSATNDLLTRSEADNDTALKLVTRYTYDAGGHLTSVNENCTTSGTTPPADASTCTGAGTQNSSTNLITSYTYTANHQLDTQTDPRGIVTKLLYDGSGNETSTIANYVSGQSSTAERNVTTSYAYDQGTTAGKAGLATSMTDPLGNVTSYAYDTAGRQLSEALPGDASIPALTRTTTYDEFGNTLTETDAWTGATRTTSYAYDFMNRQTQVTDPTGVQTDTTYNEAGDVISTSSGGVTTTKTFDGLGQPLTLTVESSTTTADYDGRGFDVATDDPTGASATATYDLGGRLLSETVDPGVGHLNLTTTHTYDLLGRETSSTTPEGVTTTTLYDRPGRVMSSTVAGAITSYAYDRAGNQISATDPDGTLTTTQYDPLNRPTLVIANDVANPTLPTEDVTTTTFYDAGGRSVAVRDDAGITSRSLYNARGMVKQTIANCTDSGTTPTSDPANCTGAGSHNAMTNVISTSGHDGSGAATVIVGAQGSGAPEATIEYAYNGAGRTQAVKDPRGTVTRTIYDSQGRVISTVANCTEDTANPQPPSGNWWTCDGSTLHDGTWNVTNSRTYDIHGNVATETAPNGRVTTYLYDAADRLVQRIDNDVATVTAPDQDLSTYYAYDDAGRQSAVRGPTANRITFAVTRYLYNAAGQLWKEIRNCTDSGTTPPSDPAWRTCSGNGTQDADTNLVTEYGYDARGNRVSVTAPDPNATTGTSTAAVVTRYAFDEQHRLCGVLENATVPLAAPDPCASPGSGTMTSNVWTRYAYDDLGNLASMIDARGNTTTYGFDGLDRTSTITDALGNTTTYTYNALVQRVSQSRRGTGSQPTLVSWTYDAAGRIASRIAGGQTTTYAYDDNGNQISASASGTTVSATYDRLNRPLTVSVSGDSGATTSYTYSLTSPSWTDPSGAYSATLDAFNRQVALTDPIHGAAQFTFSYRADSQPATIGAPNGNTTSFGYDDAGALSAKTTAAGGTNRAVYAWMRNRAGQILTESSTITNDPANGTTSYAYDPLARLTSYTRGATTAYGWQAVPNRSSVTVGGNSVTTTFDTANRPLSDTPGGSYSSDAEGRLTARPGQLLTWDDLGRLTTVKDAITQAVIAAYSYDALDRLLVVTPQTGSAYRLRYVGLTTQVAQTVDQASGSTIRSFANDWAGEHLLDWTGTGTDQHFYGTNSHHDVTWLADDTGTVTSTLRYDPWGNLTGSYGSYLPAFRFQGSLFEPTVDLSWIVARWYAPGLARFVSEDSLLGESSDPPSKHLYGYTGGNPIDRFDPDGHVWHQMRQGDWVQSMAELFMGSKSRWPVIWNQNRGRLRTRTPYVRPLTCVWIDNRYLSVQMKRALRIGDLVDDCVGSGAPTGWADNERAVQAAGAYHIDWWMLTQERLYALTEQFTQFKRNSDFGDRLRYSLNVSGANAVALGLLATGGYSSMTSYPSWSGRLFKVVNGNTSNPQAGKRGWAWTMGQYVFVNDAIHDMNTLSHEYIHVLQYQGLGLGAYSTWYALEVVGLGGLDAKGSTGPRNRAEAIAYLWGAWMANYHQYGEDYPWVTFQ